MDAVDWNTWGPPVVVLLVALVAGLGIALRLRGEGSRERSLQAEEEALIARKEALMERIQELDADRGKLSEAERMRRREGLIEEAAMVLQALAQLREGASPAAGKVVPNVDPSKVAIVAKGAEPATPAATDAPTPPPPPARGGRKLALAYGLGALVVFALIGFMLSKGTSERLEGGSMTGNSGISDRQLELEAAAARLEANPDDLEALNLLTYEALLRRDAQSAMSMVERARELDPEHAEVLVNLGIMQIMVGMGDRAEESLAAAAAKDPGLDRVKLWSGLLELQRGDKDAAVALLEAALAGTLTPVEQSIATQLLGEAKAPPVQVQLTGTVTLGAEASPAPGATLFIIVQRSAEGGGPPVAASLVQDPTFPYTFQLTDQDMMLGGVWPEEVYLTARLDADGVPTTKGEDDVVAEVLGPLAAGSEGVELKLGAGEPVVGGGLPEAGSGEVAGEARLSGRVELAEGQTLPPGGVLFVIVRRAESGGGPPVAAVKASPELPYDFVLTDADVMMGGAWPDQVWLEARIDADGNPMSRSEEDVGSPTLGPLTPGTAELTVVLGG